MANKLKEFFILLVRGLIQFGDTRPRLTLILPHQKILDAILRLKLLPEDDITQVFKDALETHNRVVGAIRQGGTVFIHKGAVAVPLNLSHLTTPELRRASFEIIKGGRDD